MPAVNRRQFLAGLGVGSVAAAVGVALRWGGGGGGPAPTLAAPPTSAPVTTTTTVPPPTTTSRPPPPTTTSTTRAATTTTTAATTTTATTTTTAPAAGARVVEVIGREAWGGSAQAGPFPAHTIERITVHHTAGFLGDNREAPGRLRRYQRFHQDSGFVDLAYHVLIDGNGNVYAARDPAIPGETFTEYDPTGHFLPVLDGNFDEQPVPPPQLDALVAVLAWAVGEYGVGATTIAGHRDYAATACPGASLYASIADGTLARLVEQQLGAGGASLVPLSPEQGAARVAAVESGQA